MTIGRGLLASLALLMALPAMAQQPPPSCQEQLLVKSTHDQLLAQKRGEVEDQLAQVAAQAAVLQHKLQLLTKENTDLKATLKTLSPPAEPKDSETPKE